MTKGDEHSGANGEAWVHHEFTAAAIEDILARGRMPDWGPLMAAIEADPYGGVAETTRALCERTLYGGPVFRRMIAAARQSRLASHA